MVTNYVQSLYLRINRGTKFCWNRRLDFRVSVILRNAFYEACYLQWIEVVVRESVKLARDCYIGLITRRMFTSASPNMVHYDERELWFSWSMNLAVLHPSLGNWNMGKVFGWYGKLRLSSFGEWYHPLCNSVLLLVTQPAFFTSNGAQHIRRTSNFNKYGVRFPGCHDQNVYGFCSARAGL